ncbi:hypothetical protein L7D48_01645 [Streptomyces sp. S1A]|uniref:hypothetical protein n=1 Tax=Streptomyces sp. ICN903 TaxID=2964654 RepID=UPI001ED9EA1C|nr:hypothetical protein [Streptomyces sp. ICN903]MCG3039285.1 hypothetical protein [Streptomyces sp. ICN903]
MHDNNPASLPLWLAQRIIGAEAIGSVRDILTGTEVDPEDVETPIRRALAEYMSNPEGAAEVIDFLRAVGIEVSA